MSVGGGQRAAAPDGSIQIHAEHVVLARVSAVERFLQTRGLDLTSVEDTVGRTVDGHSLVLLTSSPVHGLANHLSDIDTICIVEHGDDVDARMATQIFASGNHLESICFSRASVERDLDRLAEVSRMTPAQAATEHSGWNSTRTVRLKYLERLVNGVATNRTMPFADHLPALGLVWQWSSLERAARLVLYGVLAERAGESRARLAYAANAALFAMDALLSHYGEVYSNRKWFLLRWARFCRSWSQADTRPMRAIEDVRGVLARPPSAHTSIAQPLLRMITQLSIALGAPVEEVVLKSADGARRQPLLPDGLLILTPDAGAVPSPTASTPDGELKASLASFADLDSEAAVALLHAARADTLQVVIWP